MILTKEDLEIFRRWHEATKDKQSKYEYFRRVFDSVKNTNARIYQVFAFATDLVHNNAFPEVVSDKAYKNLNSTPLYRGVNSIDKHANLLVDYDYHYGDGLYATGIYASKSLKEAMEYAKNKNDVLRFKLSDDAKVVDFNGDYDGAMISNLYSAIVWHPNQTAIERFNELNKDVDLDKLDPEMKQNILTILDYFNDKDKMFDFTMDIFDNQSTVATLLGIDAVVLGNSMLILNRGKMVVSESEFKRVTNRSKLYKGGVINFEQKQEEDFLRE